MPPLSSTQTPEPVLIQSRTRHTQVTPPGTQPNRAKKAKMEFKAEPDLASVFKSDLTNLRSLVTCSICDQMLYEPFTIQCGHTYCYSCLCSWFVPNRRKKTCPECRTIIKQMPAPSFMIKQMVEVFVNRAEMMPADESVEQHATKRAEEVAAVDLDRNGPNGLFKGLFPPGRQELILDEADGVHRCPHCNTEYTGGANCEACGAEIDDDDLHNFSGDDLDEMSDMEEYEEGLRQELELEYGDRQGAAFEQMARLHQAHFNHHHHFHNANHHANLHGGGSDSITSSESRDDVGDEDESLSESGDEEGSLVDFVEHDESPIVRNRRHASPPRYNNVIVEVTPHAETPRRGQPIQISDDESDEGGPIVSRGRRSRWSRQASAQPVINLVEDDSSASDAGDMDSVAERLRDDGWSPLHEPEPDENESDHRRGVSSGSDDSDTETIGNDDGNSPQRTFNRGDFTARIGRRHEWQESDADDDASEDGTSVDRDGDTEMSVSPDAHTASRHRYEYPDSDASQPETDYDFNGDYDLNSMRANGVEQLGVGHNLQELDDDTSDGWPSDTPPRRRPRATLNRNQEQEEGFNTRISQMLMSQRAQRNPISLEDSDSVDREDFYDFQGLDFNHDHSVRQPANSSRARRPARAYRVQESRSHSAQRRTQSPSVVRITQTSIRPAGAPRSYGERRYQY